MTVGRFQIVTHPVSPGMCRICGIQYGKRPLVDTSLDADFCNRPHSDTEDFSYSMEIMGAVYFCSDCVGTMADMLGWTNPAKSQELKDQNVHLYDVNSQLNERILGLEAIVNGYQSLGISGVTSSDTDSDDSVDSEKSEGDGNEGRISESPAGGNLAAVKGGRTRPGNPPSNKPASNEVNF